MLRTAVPLSIHYAILLAFMGIYAPFGPLWLESRGFGASEIALLTGATIWARILFAPVAGELADRTERLRLIMAVMAIGALFCLVFLPFTNGYWTIFALGVGALGLYAAIMPLSETLTLSHTRAGVLDYGRIRVWGSVGICITTAGMGPLIDRFGTESVPWGMIVAMVLLVAGLWSLPRLCHPMGKLAIPPTKRIRRSGSTRALMTSPFMIVFLLASGCLMASHATYFAFSTIYWKASGADALTSGLLWVVAFSAEGLFFFFGARIVRRFTPLGLLGISAFAGMVRWAIMAATAEPIIVAFAQVLHAGTFAAAHLGAMYIIARNVIPEMASRAQALYSIVGPCLFMGAGIALAGPLYSSFGSRAFIADVAWSGAGGIGVLLLAIMMRRLPKKGTRDAPATQSG